MVEKYFVKAAIFVLSIILVSCWRPDFKHAHPNAQELMTDSFLWSPLEPTSPFGNDDGADAIWEYREWRKSNSSTPSILFIETLLDEWEYSVYDYTKIDTIEIKRFINSRDIGDRLFYGIDDVIIATGFGQLILEGQIDQDLKSLTLLALNRQLLPLALDMVVEGYRETRIQHLKRMIEILNAA